MTQRVIDVKHLIQVFVQHKTATGTFQTKHENKTENF